mgnify:CR=1 FL=1
METKSNKGMKGIITLAIVFVLCIAMVLVTTFGALTDKKTATGTITFDLADYNFKVDMGSATTEKIYPGHSANTNTVKLKNTYTGTGATAGMGGVYVKLTFTNVNIGGTDYEVESIKENSTDGTIEIVATIGSGKSSSLMTIALKQSAGKDGAEAADTVLYWRVATSEKAVYLSSAAIGTTLTDSNKAKLAFTDKNATAKTVSIDMQITGKTSDATNGFNASSASSTGLLNNYQGNTVKVNYTAAWGTTIANIGQTA